MNIYMWKFWRGFCTGVLSIVVLLVVIICIRYFSNVSSIFFNRYHEFQWSSLIVLTILFSVITLFVNTSSSSRLNHQKLVAENVAKSRIEWLSVTRKYVSDYISSVNRAYFYGSTVLDRNDKDQLQEFNQLRADVEIKYYLVLLSVNPKEEIATKLNDYQQVAEGTIPKFEKQKLNMELGKGLQVFFKNEWEKAKLEIETGKISPRDVPRS